MQTELKQKIGTGLLLTLSALTLPQVGCKEVPPVVPHDEALKNTIDSVSDIDLQTFSPRPGVEVGLVDALKRGYEMTSLVEELSRKGFVNTTPGGMYQPALYSHVYEDSRNTTLDALSDLNHAVHAALVDQERSGDQWHLSEVAVASAVVRDLIQHQELENGRPHGGHGSTDGTLDSAYALRERIVISLHQLCEQNTK